MRTLMFKIGSLGFAICFVLLLIAVLASVFLHQREFEDVEKIGAGLVAAIVAILWWLLMLRRISQRSGHD